MVISELRRRVRMIFALTETSDVARRYFSLQVFDGAMVGIGIVFGLHLSGPHEFRVVLQTLLSIMIAVFISGWTGALISERAEQAARIRRLELATLRALRNTLHGKVGAIAVLIVAFVNGLTPVAAVLAVSLPYLATLCLDWEGSVGLIGTVAVSALLLLAAGAVVGRSTGIGILRTASQMIGAGLAAAILVILLETLLR